MYAANLDEFNIAGMVFPLPLDAVGRFERLNLG